MYLTKFDKYMSNTSQYTQIPVREEYTPFSGGINPTPVIHEGRPASLFWYPDLGAGAAPLRERTLS